MAAVGDPKGFKQDMVVSIRYRNDLPPPPMPPKLLDIDNGGLAQYLTTSFASAIARREEPNIEVDAEGGMPIDMIGIPGYFLGDESAIMAPEIQPVLDPADHALMLTPDQLKNQNSKTQAVSFLRRTQYMSSQNARTNDPSVRANARASKAINKSSDTQLLRDDKENIRRHIQKGFDIAYPESVPYNPPEAKAAPSTNAERDAWRNPVHPENPRLKPVSYYPLLPDFDAFTDAGAYTSVKFDKPPVQANHGRRDDRVDVALLRSWDKPSLIPGWIAKQEAYQKNPDLYEEPEQKPVVWAYHVPTIEDSGSQVRKILNGADASKDDPALWNGLNTYSESDMQISYKKLRTYPVYQEQALNSSRFMALSLFDPDTASSTSRLASSGQGRAAYYYPIEKRLRMRADRSKLGRTPHQSQRDEDEDPTSGYDGVVLSIGNSLTVERDRVIEKLRRDESYRAEYERVNGLWEMEQKSEAPVRSQEDTEMANGEEERNGGVEVATNGVGHGHRVGAEDDANADADADAMDDD